MLHGSVTCDVRLVHPLAPSALPLAPSGRNGSVLAGLSRQQAVPLTAGCGTPAGGGLWWPYLRWTMSSMLVELHLDGDAAPMIGAELHGLGVRGRCESVAPAKSSHDHVEGLASEPGGLAARYEVTGSVGDFREFTVGSGMGPDDVRLGEFVIAVREGDRELHLLGEIAVAAAGPVLSGSRVTVECALSVISDYEWDAFGLPEQVRASWRVERIVAVDDNCLYLDLSKI